MSMNKNEKFNRSLLNCLTRSFLIFVRDGHGVNLWTASANPTSGTTFNFGYDVNTLSNNSLNSQISVGTGSSYVDTDLSYRGSVSYVNTTSSIDFSQALTDPDD
jgi:hypothetical protein